MTDSPCERFEHEGLLALEQGRDLDPHFDTCADCLEARAAYENLFRAISEAGADDAPAPQWQAGVWARIARRQERRRKRWWSGWLVPGWLVPAGMAAAVVATLFAVLVTRAPSGLELTLSIEPGPAVRRGTEAQPGDRLVLSATTDGAAHAELRVYRDDAELILRCSDEPPCRRRGDRLRASVVLPAVGTYQPLVLVSEAPLPAAGSAGLDADAAAALASGARAELGATVLVQ